MLSRKTKKSKLNGAIAPLLIGLLGISSFALWHGLSVPASAEETQSNAVSVTGVANVTEYLTSLVLYATDPMSSTAVVLKFDSNLNALVVEGAVNADALAAGSGAKINGSGNVILGGDGNQIKKNGTTSTTNYSTIVGGKNNVINGVQKSTGSVIIGGSNNSIGNQNKDSLVIGSYNAVVKSDSYNGGHAVYLGGSGVSTSATNAGNYLVLGEGNNKAESNSVLMGKDIQTIAGKTASFIWSQSGTFKPSLAETFYANTENGFGLNTNKPKLMLDIKASGIITMKENTSLATSVLVTCNDKANGVIAYINIGGVAGLCGCNGKVWVPLTIDPVTQYACADGGTSNKNCLGNPSNATTSGNTKAMKRWFQDLNDGNGGRSYLTWTYSGVESLNGGNKECSYVCKTGYHPGVQNPDGWFTGNCIACTAIANSVWLTAGTGVDDCKFACNAGYKYDAQGRTCTSCAVGEWTTAKNQSGSCERCTMPKGITNLGKVFTGGVDLRGDPYFFAFTTTGTSSTSCKFTCRSGYAPSGYACRECSNGYYSEDGATSCLSCTNGPDPISFWWRNYVGETAQTKTVGGKGSLFNYTSKGNNGPESCEWQCLSYLGMEEVNGQCVCKNKDQYHLEVENGVARCVANVKDWTCGAGEEGAPDVSSTIRGASVVENVGGHGTWTGWEWYGVKREYVDYNTYVANGSVLGACKWTCPSADHEKSGNKCNPPKHGECSNLNGSAVQYSTMQGLKNNQSALCSGSTLRAPAEREQLSYYDIDEDTGEKRFNFSYNKTTNALIEKTPEARYEWTWYCEGKDNKDEYRTQCASYEVGTATSGQCDGTKRTGTSGQYPDPACKTFDSSVCSYSYGCPPLTGVVAISNGKTWKCPGAYGGEWAVCGGCNVDYTWDNKNKNRCMKTIVYWACSQGEKPTSNFSSPRYVIGSGYYKVIFSGEAGKYFTEDGKELMSWVFAATGEVISGSANEASLCRFKCGDGYHKNGSICSPNVYDLSYEYNGGSKGTYAPSTAEYNNSFTISNPGKVGYLFTGWNIAGMDNISHTIGSVTTTSSTYANSKATSYKNLRMYEGTVYFTAQWTPIKYKIAFNSNGGTGTMSAVNGTYDVSLTLPTNTFTKSGSKFKGWSKSAYSSTVAYEDKASVSNLSTTNNATVTLYAVWETCEAGEYSEGTSCVLCPFGYTSNAGASSKSQCYISVSAGKYIETTNSTTQKSCPAGTYKAAHTVNYGSTSSCANCSCGYYSAAGAESCIACGAGKWSNAGSSSCSSISAGYYGTSACSATANKCAAGTYSEGGVSSCSNCPSYYTSDEGTTGKTSCYISVSGGSRKSSAYGTTTTQCSAGTYREAHKGYYGETTSCKTCASGTSSSTGATSCTSTSTSCTWKYWDVYGGSCTSNATDNCSSSVNTGGNNSANQCSTFHAYCCYKRGTASEREMICKCG